MPRNRKAAPPASRDTPQTQPALTGEARGPLILSPEAQRVHDEIAGGWDLTPPVAALLRLACEALTKAGDCEAITARDGMMIGDMKGSVKPNPAALLARDYRAQASLALQRLLTAIEG